MKGNGKRVKNVPRASSSKGSSSSSKVAGGVMSSFFAPAHVKKELSRSNPRPVGGADAALTMARTSEGGLFDRST